MTKQPRLGDLLLESGAITEEQLSAALAEQKKSGLRLGETLLKMGVLTDGKLLDALSSQLKLQVFSLSRYRPMPEALRMVPEQVAKRLNTIPLSVEDGNTLLVAMSDPLDIIAQDEIRMITGMDIKLGLVSQSEIERNLERLYSIQESLADASVEFMDSSATDIDLTQAMGEASPDDAPVIQLVNNVVEQAVREGASDIHIEPFEKNTRVRYRIDGQLFNALDFPKNLHPAVSSRKTVGGLLQGLAGVTKVVADERLRMLYVTGRPEQFLEVEKVLQQIDHPGRQVMLQARIIEVTDSGKEELETIIDAVYNQWWFNYSSAGAGLGYVYADNPAAYDPQGGDDRPSPLRPITGDGLNEIASGNLTKMLDFGLRALVTKNKGKVIADPSIITIDGQKAVIKLVENYPYISERDEAGNPTWSEKEVGPIMEFTPQVGRDQMVTVQLKIQTGEIIGTYRGQAGEQFPQTTEREVTTNIRVRDGEPFVVGGLFKDQEKVEKHRIPLLSDIPLLGELFKFKSESRDKTEVAMIVIPYILEIPDTTVETYVLK